MNLNRSLRLTGTGKHLTECWLKSSSLTDFYGTFKKGFSFFISYASAFFPLKSFVIVTF